MSEEIQETPQPTQPVPPVSVETKKKSILPIIVISLIAISLIAVVGVMFGMQLEKKKVKVWVEPPLSETTPQPTLIPDETANWKTYTGEGFSFKYPENYDVEKTDKGIIVWKDKNRPTLIPGTPFNPAIYFQVSLDNLNRKNFEQYIKDKFGFPENKSLSDFLDGMGWEYSWKKPNYWFYFRNAEGPGEGTFDNFIIGKEIVLNIVTYSHESLNKQFDQILSTFKFTQ